MSRPQLSPEQQKELERLQQMAQKHSQLNQQFTQMQSRQKELERTNEALENLDDDEEIYKNVGQLMLKTKVGETREEIKEELELLEVRVNRAKKQVDELSQKIEKAQNQLRDSIQ